jgi:hypothetical protein
MRISFFEEYPLEKNLSKIKIIPFQTNLYLGCRNVKEFLELRAKLKKKFKNLDKVIYWPILDLSEGYWLSAFSKTSAIKRVFKELKSTEENFPVLWDAELPILNKRLFFTEILHFPFNRNLIHKVLQSQKDNHPLIVAELPRDGVRRLLSIMGGSSFPFSNYHRLDMLYTSMLKIENKEKYVRGVIRNNKNRFKRYSVGLGLIERGEEDHVTPLISPKELERDLTIVKKERIREVVIYRLGGLNKRYLSVLKKYAKN